MREEYYQALLEYSEKYGKGWANRLTLAWYKDWKEQWGVLRSLRNECLYEDMESLVKAFKSEKKLRSKNHA